MATGKRRFAERGRRGREGFGAGRRCLQTLFHRWSRPGAFRAQAAQELRKLRRHLDQFVYEPVMVGSFEDAVLGVILNGSVQAAVIYDSIPFASIHNSPILREVLADHLGVDAIKKGTQDY